MSAGETSLQQEEGLKIVDSGKNLVEDRICRCGEKESSEHFIFCKNESTAREIKVEWPKESNHF